MPNRTMIVSMLLPAYLLLVLHSVIPHHHHAPAHHGPVQYHHGSHVHHDHHPFGDHHHDHDHHPASHFVHAPDFGNAMLRSDADLVVEAPDPFPVHDLLFGLKPEAVLTKSRPDFPILICQIADEKIWGTAGRGPPVS